MSARTCSRCSRTHEGGYDRCLSGVLLVCGGRDYDDRARVWRVLDRVALRVQISAVRHGAAKGADSLAGEWARERGFVEDPCPADWYPARLGGRLDRGAGHRRNAEMLAKGGVVACVAFPGGSGTANMVERAQTAGIPVWEIAARRAAA